MKKTIFFSLIFAFLGSCKSGENNEFIEIQVVPPSTVLVPSARQSCTDIADGATSETKSIPESSLGFRKFKLSWKDTKRDFFILKVSLDFTSGVVENPAPVSDPDELSNLLGVTDTKVDRASGTNSNQWTVKESDNKPGASGFPNCGLSFGGMKPPDDISISVSAKLKVVGIAVDDSFKEELIRTEIPVKVFVDTKN